KSLVESILLVLLIPFAAALLVRKISRGKKTTASGIVTFLEKGQVLFLALAVVAMFASEGKSLVENPDVIFSLLVPVLVFFVVTFFIARLTGRLLRFNYEDRVSLTLTTMARNSPIALAIAVAAFPTQPLIALSL